MKDKRNNGVIDDNQFVLELCSSYRCSQFGYASQECRSNGGIILNMAKDVQVGAALAAS